MDLSDLPGRTLYFDESGEYLGGSGPGGKGRRPKGTAQEVNLEEGMGLLFEGIVDTGNHGGRLRKRIPNPAGIKPAPPGVIIIVPPDQGQPTPRPIMPRPGHCPKSWGEL